MSTITDNVFIGITDANSSSQVFIGRGATTNTTGSQNVFIGRWASRLTESILPQKKVSLTAEPYDAKVHSSLGCSICLNDFLEGDSLHQTRCHHWYHSQCLIRWMKHKDTCPLCRRGLN